MPSFPHDCPHCHTKSASFRIHSEFRSTPLQTIQALVVCQVVHCQKCCVAVFSNPDGGYSLISHFLSNPGKFRLLDFYPEPETAEIPEHLPGNVCKFYSDAINIIQISPDGAGIMFRKALEAGLKHICPNAKGNLVDRIKEAAKAGKISQDIADAANRVRLGGNEAAHSTDEQFTPEEAEELYDFTRILMMSLFTLPGMLEEWKGKIESKP